MTRFRSFLKITGPLALALAAAVRAADPPPPVSPRDLFEKAVHLSLDERYGEAIPLYEEIIRLDPASLASWESLGWAYWNTGRQADAITLWERLRAIDPARPLPYNLLAKAAASQGELDKAVALSRKSLELDPQQTGAAYDLARFLLWSGRIDESTALLKQTLEKDPDRLDVVLDLARSYSNQRFYDQALPLWQRLTAQAPDHADYLAMEAVSRLHLNQPEPARALFTRVLTLQPDHLAALEGMADLEEFGAAPARAAPWLRALIKALPTPAEKEAVRIRLINLLVRLHRLNPLDHTLNEPRDLVEERLDYNPRSVDAMLLKGELSLMDLQFPAAESQFIEVLRDFNPYNLRARRGLFETYLAVKRFDLAREQLDHIRAFNPLDPYLDYLLARLESTRGSFPAAFDALNRLEAAGRRGAVAVLLYHGINHSLYLPDSLALDRFRDQLRAMREAGFQFVPSGEIPALFDTLAHPPPPAAARPLPTLPPPQQQQQPTPPPPSPPPPEPAVRILPATPKARARVAPEPILSATPRPAPTPATPPSPPPPEPEPEPIAGMDLPGPPATPVFVSINFDDGRRDSMRLATLVAQEFDLVFSHHIPCGYILQNHPFIVSWELLRDYVRTGRWEIGSHFLDAAILTPLDATNNIGRALPNLVWRPDLARIETPEEYTGRLHREFEESRRLLRLHTGQRVNFISYPFGDIGQETESNLINPAPVIAETGRAFYDIGFLQSVFGFAVAGDDPLFYQRHEMDRWMNGSNVVEYVYAHHPVFLARRLRAEYAALSGKQYRALENVDWLARNGYPAPLVEETRRYVRARLGGGFVKPARAASLAKAARDVDAFKPRLRAEGEYARDNQGRSHARGFVGGGLNIGERLALDARAGVGQFRQDVPADPADPADPGPRSLTVRELALGGRAVLLFVPDPDRPLTDLYPKYLMAGLLQRRFTGDADCSVLAIEAETQLRPILPLDLYLRYERDLAPSALAAEREITYNAGLGSAVFRTRDWWQWRASAAHYVFSDDNNRSHLGIGSHWLLHERSGFWAGLRYSYANSDEDSLAYWTPYQLHRYTVEGQFLGQYLRAYYNFRAYVGLGRENVRPEAEARFAEQSERARRERWDPGAPPESDWDPIFGVSLSVRIPLRDRLELNGEAAYNENPNYNEFALKGGLVLYLAP